MTFALYCLLADESPIVSTESLIEDLRNYFQAESCSIYRERLPFAADETISLKWASWIARVSYEEGEMVKADSLEIYERTKSFNSNDLSTINRRIRIVFGSDNDNIYTNQAIYLMDFAKKIKGVMIYDPQQNDFLKD